MRATPGDAALFLCVVCGTFASGCGPDESELGEMFERGEYLVREAEWDEARLVLREFLLSRPEHAGAHFYLGRSYLFADDFRPAIAEGELQTALRLYQRQGRKSPIERFPDDYFGTICNLESAKVCMRQFFLLRDLGVPPMQLRPLARRARGYVEAARVIGGDSDDVLSADQIVQELERSTGLSGARPPA